MSTLPLPDTDLYGINVKMCEYKHPRLPLNDICNGEFADFYEWQLNQGSLFVEIQEI